MSGDILSSDLEKKMESSDVSANVGDGNDVVITGMAGLYPKARHIKDLENILYNKINPISSDGIRFKYDHPDIPRYMGNVPDMDRFDAQYFKVHYHLALNMDCISRKLLELSYEAIYDSGMSPQHLNGKKVGVFMASSYSETENGLFYCTWRRIGFAGFGCARSLFANRISYWLNLTGPSIAIDQACCGSAAALTAAYNAISIGECDSAIIGGGFSCLHPQYPMHCSKILNLSDNGKTRSFCEDAAGCAMSEAMNVLFLQKAKDAKRIYATVVYAKSVSVPSSSETGLKFGFYRVPADTAKFLRTFYAEASVQPSAVEYVEAFGSADPEADKSELEAIEEVFCTGREEPLLVGSVMSNLGYSELASGLNSVTKVLLGYHKGLLAGNLHCSVPRKDIKAIQDGRLQVLTDHHPFRRTYAAVNNMSLSGVNAHILLRGFYKPKNLDQYKTNLPRLITVSARHERAVETVLGNLKSNPIDAEQIALLHNIHEENVPGNLGKGYIILDASPSGFVKTLVQKAQYSDEAKRPLWFVYSGVGSQWTGMGAQLMRIPIFAASIQRCSKVLEPKGIDLLDIITSSNPNTFDNIINTFIGIAAIQIGLTDILYKLGFFPDKIIGHSAGEVACGYADGCLSVEDAMLSAYCRGRVSLDTTFIPGAMAAVGIGAQQMFAMIPPELEVACHNSADCCTISGPAEDLRAFVATLTERGIFAKEVNCSNIAYHSRYVADAGPSLLKYLQEVIKVPKPRSERWISTSVPQDRWDETESKYCSAEYQTNNLLNPVLFEEVCALMPPNAVSVEIAPHGLLQAILKRSLPASVTNISLTRRENKDNVTMLLESIGELYLQGFNPKLRALYPEVQFPVSTGTPFLSHFVEWDHEECWPLALYPTNVKLMTACRTHVTTIHGDNEFLRGHVVQNKILLPPSYILVDVWDTLAMSLKLPKKSFSVEFSDVVFYAQPTLLEQKAVRLSISLHRGSGLFEVMEEDSKVATGTIVQNEKYFSFKPIIQTCKMDLMYSDVYRILYDRGYSYSGDFQSIYCVDASISNAKILWNNNWVTFLEAILQLNLLKFTSSGLVKPIHIRRLIIDVQKHFEDIRMQEKNRSAVIFIDTQLSELPNQTTTNGILVENVQFCDVLHIDNEQVTLQPFEFIPKDAIEQEVVDSNQEDEKPLEDDPVKDEELLIESDIVRHWNSLKWVPELSVAERTLDVLVHYAGFNFGDAKQAIGFNSHISSENRYGIDYSGVTERGDRIMGVALHDTASNKIKIEEKLTWPVPKYWTLEEAATVPSAYLFAYYCLLRVKTFLGHLRVNVLIHGGLGALGQAAISIALGRGWRVFSTVRDLDQKRLLLQLFPRLNGNDIGFFRDSTFREMVLCATNGKGCNIVICCLKEELKNCSLACAGLYGVFINTVQIPHNENFKFGMAHLVNAKSYVTVDFRNVFRNLKSKETKIVYALVSEGIDNGEVRPLARATFAPDEAAQALCLLDDTYHRGCVLIKVGDTTISTVESYSIEENPCNVIFCGTGSTGLHIVDKLKENGINKFYVHINGSYAGYLEYKMRFWKRNNIDVVLSYGTIKKNEEVIDILKSSMKLGITKAIHIVMDGFFKETIADMIDEASRNLCPHLKHFVVLSSDMDVGRNTCINRVENGLPATFLDISKLNTTLDANGNVSYKGVADAVEQAWRSSSTILQAIPKPTPERSLVQHVADLADLNLEPETDDGTSLNQLGVSAEKYLSIGSFIRDMYNTHLDENDVGLLTIDKLTQIEVRNNNPLFEEANGLKTFFSVDCNELLGSLDMVAPRLVGQKHSMSEDTEHDEYDSKEAYLYIIPGLDGLYGRFRVLCESLKLGAYVLQPGFDHFDETPQNTALRYSKLLLKRLRIEKKFYILAYETGVTVALELAHILEKEGFNGTIFILGEGPHEMQALLESELIEYPTENELQDALAIHFFKLFSENIDTNQMDCEKAKIDELEIALCGSLTWEGRVDACVGLLVGRVAHSAQYMRAQLKAAYSRLEVARRAPPPACVLHSQIVLMRARTQLATADNTHTLQRYSTQNIHVVNLETPLPHVIRDLRVPAIIHYFLDVDVLQAFENKNLCDGYYF